MNLHFDPEVVAAASIRRDLGSHPLEADAVISGDGPFEVFTEGVIDICPYPGNKGSPFFAGRLLKLGVEGGHIDLGQVSISLVHVGNAVKGQLLDQPILVGLESSFASPPCLGNRPRSSESRAASSHVQIESVASC
jgi:hypothetical protein